jgi:CheY-like chemotaxis protein/two-component sensor histidine kinase
MSGGRHLLALINEVLDLARIESGHLSLTIEPVSLTAVLDDALKLLSPQAVVAGVSLPAHAPAGADIHVDADQQWLRQIVVNLLSNAVKYNHKSGAVSLTCERRDDGRLRLGVTDTGPGIAADEAQRIFQPFERLGASSTPVEGTGLGLAVSKSLAEAMGARIGLTSVPGMGSTFWVDLSVADCQRTALNAPVPGCEQFELGSGPAQPVNVLYIEDNPSNIQLVQALLSRLPHISLLIASSGHMGLQLAEERLPDLVLLDLDLPDISGTEVLARLQGNAATHAIAVVVVSADATDSSVRRLLDAGATAYLTKPLDAQLFLTVVDDAVRSGPCLSKYRIPIPSI